MRKAVCTAVAVITAFSLCVMPAAASEIDVLESQKAAAESEVATLQSDLESLVEAVAQLEQDLIVKGEEIAEVQADLDAAEKKEELQRTAMGLRIKYMYEEGNPSLMNAILASENLAEVLNKAEYA